MCFRMQTQEMCLGPPVLINKIKPTPTTGPKANLIEIVFSDIFRLCLVDKIRYTPKSKTADLILRLHLTLGGTKNTFL